MNEPKFNLRKAGEGSDFDPKWKKTTAYRKERENVHDDDDEEEILYPQRVNRAKKVIQVDFRFSETGASGPGGREEADAAADEALASDAADSADKTTGRTARAATTGIGLPVRTDRREGPEPDLEGEGVVDAAKRLPTSTTRCRSHPWDKGPPQEPGEHLHHRGGFLCGVEVHAERVGKEKKRNRSGPETKPLFLGDIRYRLFSPSLLPIQQHLRVLQLSLVSVCDLDGWTDERCTIMYKR